MEEKTYIQKLNNLPEEVRVFVLNIPNDTNFDSFVKSKFYSTEDIEDKIDILKNNTMLFVLGFIKINDFFEKLQDLFEITELEVEGSINLFLDKCLNQDVKNYIEENLNRMTLDIEKASIEEKTPIKEIPEYTHNESISHIDILSEIENPTPSLKTTNLSQTQQPTQNSATNTQTVPPNHLAQPHQTELGGFNNTQNTNTNPAQNIASKLNQNLSTPTTSIPKEIYVSKKPDPYHEPVI